MLSADTNKSSGVFTCQTCNSLFTCLDVYQKHRQQHAQKEGVKLLTCAHCTYVSDNEFHYNWHIMSHASQAPHRCDVCSQNYQQNSSISSKYNHQYQSNNSNTNPNNNSNDNDDEDDDDDEDENDPTPSNDICDDFHEEGIHNLRVSSTLISNDGKRRSIATETSDDLILLSQIYSSPSSSPGSQTFDDGNIDYIDQQQENNNDYDEETETEEDEDNFPSTHDMIPSTPNCDNYLTNTIQQQQEQQQQQQFNENNYVEDNENNDDNEIGNEEQFQEFDLQHQQQPDSIISNGYTDQVNNNVDDQIVNNNDLSPQQYEENLNNNDNCDMILPEQQQQQHQTTSDVYDFKIEDDSLDQPPQYTKLNMSKSSSSAPLAAVVNPTINPSFANSLTTFANNAIQLQKSIFNASTSQRLSIVTPPNTNVNCVNNQRQQQQQQQIQQQTTHQISSTFVATQSMNTNFIFPAAAAVPVQNVPVRPVFGQPTNASNHHHHAGPSNAAAIFNAGPFAAANGPHIRLVSLQPFQQPQNQPSTSSFIPSAQTNGTSFNNNSISLSTTVNHNSSTIINNNQNSQLNLNFVRTKRKYKKSNSIIKSTKKGSENDYNHTNNNITDNNIATIITPESYQSMKGKGKGNRKPRITFVSVINGVTVGSDGIRRKFQCSHCGNGKCFKTKSHLQRHLLTHTGEKPYQCDECGSKFNQSSSLRNHKIAIHTKRFPHTCTICGKGFLMPAVLQKHMQTTGHKSLITTNDSLTQFSNDSLYSQTPDGDSSNSEQQQQQQMLLKDENNPSLQFYNSNNSEDDDNSSLMNNVRCQIDDDNDDEEDQKDPMIMNYFKENPNLKQNGSSHSNHHPVSTNNFPVINSSTSSMTTANQQQRQQPFLPQNSQSNIFFILTNPTVR